MNCEYASFVNAFLASNGSMKSTRAVMPCCGIKNLAICPCFANKDFISSFSVFAGKFLTRMHVFDLFFAGLLNASK